MAGWISSQELRVNNAVLESPENEETIRAFQSGQRGERAGWSGVKRAAAAIKAL